MVSVALITVRKKKNQKVLKKKILIPLPKHRIMKRWLVLAGLLIAGPAQANTYPNFTQGSMTSTTITETTVTENVEIEKMGGDYLSVSGVNVTASGSIGAEATTYEITTPGENFSIEVVTRDAGVVETQSITRTLDITSTTNSLSVFSQ